MRWVEGVEKDLRNLGVVKWRTKTKERDSWRKFLGQAKAQEDFVVPIIIIIIIFNSCLFTCILTAQRPITKLARVRRRTQK
jgi:hypothetical protein